MTHYANSEKGEEDYSPPPDKAYQNKCIECSVVFIGYKLQSHCKVCSGIINEFENQLSYDDRIRFMNMNTKLMNRKMELNND